VDPRLQGGAKIPKRRPSSCRGQIIGTSEKHASSVGMIRHLVTNNISPQYHVVYDNHFETAYANEETPPEEWERLLFIHRELANFDDKQKIPELSRQWLDAQDDTLNNEKEVLHCNNQEAKSEKYTEDKVNRKMGSNQEDGSSSCYGILTI